MESSCASKLSFLWLCSLLWLLVIVPSTVRAESVGINVEDIQPYWNDGVYQLNALVLYDLSPEVLDALDSGVPITFTVDIVITRERKYWVDDNVAALKQQYQLRYHALSDQYILTNLNSGAKNSFPSLRAALAVMGNIVALPLIDDQLLRSGLSYFGRMRVVLDTDFLPTPLRLLAYVTSGWRLKSEWLTWNVSRNTN